MGSVKTYTLSGADIKAGQPLCVDMSVSGPITCKKCSANTSAEDIIGISSRDASAGDAVPVMTNGFYIRSESQEVEDEME